MKAKALFTIISKKLRDGEVLFVDSVSFTAPKSAEAREVLSNLGSIKGFETLATKRKNAAYIATDTKNVGVEKSFGNFSNIVVDELRNVNPVTIMNYKYLVITNPASSLATLSAKLS
jgi:large subunit ribosomal protein L4